MGHRVVDGVKVAIRRKTDVVELDFVKTELGCLQRDQKVVTPGFLIIRIGPAHMVAVVPEFPLVIMDTRRGPVARSDVVLKNDLAADGITPAFSQVAQPNGKV